MFSGQGNSRRRRLSGGTRSLVPAPVGVTVRATPPKLVPRFRRRAQIGTGPPRARHCHPDWWHPSGLVRWVVGGFVPLAGETVT